MFRTIPCMDVERISSNSRKYNSFLLPILFLGSIWRLSSTMSTKWKQSNLCLVNMTIRSTLMSVLTSSSQSDLNLRLEEIALDKIYNCISVECCSYVSFFTFVEPPSSHSSIILLQSPMRASRNHTSTESQCWIFLRFVLLQRSTPPPLFLFWCFGWVTDNSFAKSSVCRSAKSVKAVFHPLLLVKAKPGSFPSSTNLPASLLGFRCTFLKNGPALH